MNNFEKLKKYLEYHPEYPISFTPIPTEMERLLGNICLDLMARIEELESKVFWLETQTEIL